MGQEQTTNTINIETLKAGEDTISKTLAKLYTKCLSERRIPRARKNAKNVIIYNKEIRKYLKSYISICLVFTKVLTKRLEKTLNVNQPRKQAGFRSRYSRTDHIHVVNQLKEKWKEYNTPPCTAFVEYDKAVDSVQNQQQGIGYVYIELLKEIYTSSSMTVQLHN